MSTQLWRGAIGVFVLVGTLGSCTDNPETTHIRTDETTTTTEATTTTQSTTTTTTTTTLPPTTTTAAAPKTTTTAAATQQRNCDASYPDVCIPSPPPDLNCPDVQYKNFRVVGNDPHGFDRDRDGYGCES